MYLGTDPGSVDEAVSATQTELERLRQEKVTADELERAKKYMTGSYEISLQSNAAQSEELAFNELYGLGHTHGRLYLDHIQQVTQADVQRVANTYLNPSEQTLVIVGQNE